MTEKSIGIGMLGCGTVGTGVLRLLRDRAGAVEDRLGCRVEIRAITVRDLRKDRDAVVPGDRLVAEPSALLDDPEIRVVIEVMGGIEPTFGWVVEALRRGKSVITANKALLAAHGDALFDEARRGKADLMFEASVGGGVPVIRALRESLASDRIERISAIINGTSNYVLTRMEQEGVDIDVAVAEAQRLGYAEADPTADIDGHDAHQKLRILMALAFGVPLSAGSPPGTSGDAVRVQSIRQLTPLDLRYAKLFGYRIKPVAVACRGDDGIDGYVGPALVPRDHILAGVQGVFNAAYIQSRALGPLLFSGRGAGMMPTAVSVVSDLVEACRNLLSGTTSRLPSPLRGAPGLVDSDRRTRAHFLRFAVTDQLGVLGRIATMLGSYQVSIDRMIQDPHGDQDLAQVIMLTHPAPAEAVRAAVAAIDAEGFVGAPTHILPVDDVDA